MEKSAKTMSMRDICLALLVAFLWGINFAVAKPGVTEFPPLLFVFLRFTLIALILVPFKPLPAHSLKPIALLGLTFIALHFPLIFIGLSHIDSSLTSLLAQLGVPFSSIVAAIFFKDMLGWRRALGIALAFGGVAIIAGMPQTQSNPWAVTAIIAGCFVWAIGNMQMKKLDYIDGLTINAWAALFALPVLLTLTLVFETGHLQAIQQASWKGWFAIGFTALAASITGYTIWYGLMARNDINQVVPFTLLAPIFGVLSGILLLGEQMTITAGIGGVMIIGGMAIILLRHSLRLPRLPLAKNQDKQQTEHPCQDPMA